VGEFQKRIKALLEPVKIEYDSIRKISTTTFDIHRLSEKIELIVEEAKKDFPTLQQIEEEYRIVDKATHTEPEVLGVWVSLASKQKEWFERWF